MNNQPLFLSLIAMKPSAAAITIPILLIGCSISTVQEIPRPGGGVEYLLTCEEDSECYGKAKKLCPSGYTTISDDSGAKGRELVIACLSMGK
jgi:hypothetical protein